MTTTVLAVDDSKTLRRVLEITFAGDEFRTILAENAGDALAKLARENPAVAVVDAHLGGESGYDLCQQLKERAPNLPVVILSSKQQPFDRARGSAVGADDFMDKPFDTQQLIDKVVSIVRRGAGAPVARPAAAAAPTAAAARPAPYAQRPAVAAAGNPPAVSHAPARPAATPFTPAARPAPAAAPASAAPMTRPGIGLGAPAAARPAQPVTPAARPGARPAGSSPQASPPRVPTPAPVARPVAPAMPSRAEAVAATPTTVSAAVALPAGLSEKLGQLGLSAEQVQAVLALSREVVERVVWEVVPVLAETLIKEEIERLTAE